MFEQMGEKIATSQHIQLSESKAELLSVLLDILVRQGMPSIFIIEKNILLQFYLNVRMFYECNGRLVADLMEADHFFTHSTR